jgi:hypothetical protein
LPSSEAYLDGACRSVVLEISSLETPPTRMRCILCLSISKMGFSAGACAAHTHTHNHSRYTHAHKLTHTARCPPPPDHPPIAPTKTRWRCWPSERVAHKEIWLVAMARPLSRATESCEQAHHVRIRCGRLSREVSSSQIDSGVTAESKEREGRGREREGRAQASLVWPLANSGRHWGQYLAGGVSE